MACSLPSASYAPDGYRTNNLFDYRVDCRISTTMTQHIMKMTAVIMWVGSLLGSPVYAQVIVNPDGTHSVQHGSVIVNSDGSHSVKHGSVLVNPNGSHSVIHEQENGNATIINPDGSHSIKMGSVLVDPDGSHTILPGDGKNAPVYSQPRKRSRNRRWFNTKSTYRNPYRPQRARESNPRYPNEY